MKKTMRFLSLAALALVGAVMTGCSNEDDFTVEPENKSNVVTLTTTVGIGGGAETRALADDGKKTFAAGEQLAVIYKNTSGTTVKAVSAALTAGDIQSGNKTATFTFTLEDPNKGQNVKYIYPAAMAGETDVDYSNLASQNGSLATLSSDLDLATYSGAWDGASLPSATLTNQLAFLAINLKNEAGSSDITSSITGVTVSDGTNTYTVTRAAAAGPIYVAIRPTDSANIEVTATDGSTDYTKSLTGKTYEASNGYNVSWRMTKVKPAAEATAEDKGKLIGRDGKIYANVAAATAAGTTAMAKIIYIGTTGHATYNHGLALALTNEGQMAWEAAKTACNNKNTSTPVTDATWLLASKDQWNYMLGTDGAGSDYALRTGFSSVGGSNMQSDHYWSCTEYSSPGWAWYYDFLNGKFNFGANNREIRVRACLAF